MPLAKRVKRVQFRFIEPPLRQVGFFGVTNPTRYRELEEIIESTERKVVVFVPITSALHLVVKYLREAWKKGRGSLRERRPPSRELPVIGLAARTRAILEKP